MFLSALTIKRTLRDASTGGGGSSPDDVSGSTAPSAAVVAAPVAAENASVTAAEEASVATEPSVLSAAPMVDIFLSSVMVALVSAAVAV